jgi:hypothetical protein
MRKVRAAVVLAVLAGGGVALSAAPATAQETGTHDDADIGRGIVLVGLSNIEVISLDVDLLGNQHTWAAFEITLSGDFEINLLGVNLAGG